MRPATEHSGICISTSETKWHKPRTQLWPPAQGCHSRRLDSQRYALFSSWVVSDSRPWFPNQGLHIHTCRGVILKDQLHRLCFFAAHAVSPGDRQLPHAGTVHPKMLPRGTSWLRPLLFSRTRLHRATSEQPASQIHRSARGLPYGKNGLYVRAPGGKGASRVGTQTGSHTDPTSPRPPDRNLGWVLSRVWVRYRPASGKNF